MLQGWHILTNHEFIGPQAFETFLIPAATFKAKQKEPLPLDIDTDLPSYLAECRQRLEDT